MKSSVAVNKKDKDTPYLAVNSKGSVFLVEREDGHALCLHSGDGSNYKIGERRVCRGIAGLEQFSGTVSLVN